MRIELSTFMLTAAMLAACSNDSPTPQPQPEPPFVEPTPERVVYTQANVVYYGDEGFTGVSDLWKVMLYTDMDIDPAGNLVGPGKLICISCNAPLSEGMDLDALAGTYTMSQSSNDFSAGTFNDGRLMTIDLPDGSISMPDFSFYGEPADDATDFDPDLLREGYCSVVRNDDGTHTVEGIMTGTKFLKRYFSYTGIIEPVDRSETPAESIPNSNLTEDIRLEGMTQARLQDLGDYFFLQDGSYRMFRLMLAEPGVDISTSQASGDGRYLKLEILVEHDADVEQGLPAGEYAMCVREENGGIDRDQIRPWHVLPGLPDKFNNPDGSWYQHITSAGNMPQYARLAGGRIVVEAIEGVEGGRRIRIELTDCDAAAPHRVECTVDMIGKKIVKR